MNKICEIMILSCSFKHSPMTIRVIHGINCGHFFKMLILIAPRGRLGNFFPTIFKNILVYPYPKPTQN